MSVKLVIAEDNSFLLKAILEKLSLFPDLEVKFHAFNGQKLLEKLEKDPNVILIPKMNGIKAVELISQKYPQIKNIKLTVFDDDEKIFRAIQGGANGIFLRK